MDIGREFNPTESSATCWPLVPAVNLSRTMWRMVTVCPLYSRPWWAPPSTGIAAPVTKRAASEHRKATTFALLLGVDRSTPPALAAADLRTPAGDVVGEVILHPGSSPALFLTMPGWAEQVERYAEPGETYALRIGRAGQAPRVVPFDVADDGTWATSSDTDPDAITSVAVVDTDGDVWCEGEL